MTFCYGTPRTKLMNLKEDQELEDFIEEWYYGDEIHEFAKALGRYLLQFIDHLSEQDTSVQTRRKHMDNSFVRRFSRESVLRRSCPKSSGTSNV